MQEIYRTLSAEAAADRLDEFEQRWGASCDAIARQLAGALGGNHIPWSPSLWRSGA